MHSGTQVLNNRKQKLTCKNGTNFVNKINFRVFIRINVSASTRPATVDENEPKISPEPVNGKITALALSRIGMLFEMVSAFFIRSQSA